MTDETIGPHNAAPVDQARVDGIREANKHKATARDFEHLPGFQRLPGGKWRVRFQPNDGHGKFTKVGAEVLDIMRPGMRADAERQAKLAKPEQAALLTPEGVRHVDPALAEQTARQNGWTHHWRAGGSRVESGIGGMLWRRCPDGSWEPLGRRTLTDPYFESEPLDSIQFDPAGNAWVLTADQEWSMLEDSP
jgi:hypothetical protein